MRSRKWLAVIVAAAVAVAGCSSRPGHSQSAAQLAARLKAHGEPVTGLVTYKGDGSPGAWTSKAAWRGGSIEVFASAGDAQSQYTILRRLAPFSGYAYLDGDAVLSLSYNFSPAQARAYEAAFAG